LIGTQLDYDSPRSIAAATFGVTGGQALKSSFNLQFRRLALKMFALSKSGTLSLCFLTSGWKPLLRL
jgi:hypothetical protein